MPSQHELFLKAGALQTAILTSANFALIATDERGVIQIFNVGAQRMLGYAENEVINNLQSSAMFDTHDVKRRATELSTELGVLIAPGIEALSYKASRGIEDVAEMSYLCKDGSRLPAIVSTTALHDESGSLIGYLLIGTDNSARKQVETALSAALHAAETASTAKTDFLSRMSHELRTPLNAILGFAQLLESGSPKPTTVQQQSLDEILKAGWFLLALINEVLDLALVESGQLVLTNQPIPVDEVLRECETMMEPQALAHGIRMVFPDRENLHYVLADRIRFKQVLINLLMNAIKYNRRGGVVLVDYSVDTARSLRIHIRDSGIGMSVTQLAQLFQPFNRLGRENSGEEGTGIGLLVTKRLVELMGGRIGVESAPGAGSVFWIDLQLTARPQSAGQAPENPDSAAPDGGALAASGHSQYTVLYVEDNPANLALVEQIIARRQDVRFLSAADASIGIAFARSHLPDVVLMDIHLPGISGLEAMKILRTDPRTAHIPVIALSANVVPRDIQKGIEAGFMDYITKPIMVQTFTRVLNAALARSDAPMPEATTESIS
ncbi:MAG: ATP-binding protein [Rhodoferax sp.]|nr:ATP-binding protein [Rhodoferax sp.]